MSTARSPKQPPCNKEGQAGQNQETAELRGQRNEPKKQFPFPQTKNGQKWTEMDRNGPKWTETTNSPSPRLRRAARAHDSGVLERQLNDHLSNTQQKWSGDMEPQNPSISNQSTSDDAHDAPLKGLRLQPNRADFLGNDVTKRATFSQAPFRAPFWVWLEIGVPMDPLIFSSNPSN